MTVKYVVVHVSFVSVIWRLISCWWHSEDGKCRVSPFGVSALVGKLLHSFFTIKQFSIWLQTRYAIGIPIGNEKWRTLRSNNELRIHYGSNSCFTQDQVCVQSFNVCVWTPPLELMFALFREYKMLLLLVIITEINCSSKNFYQLML